MFSRKIFDRASVSLTSGEWGLCVSIMNPKAAGVH